MMGNLEHDDHSHDGNMEVVLFFMGLFAFLVALLIDAGILKTILFISALVL